MSTDPKRAPIFTSPCATRVNPFPETTSNGRRSEQQKATKSSTSLDFAVSGTLLFMNTGIRAGLKELVWEAC